MSARDRLLAELVRHADAGWVCPSLVGLANLTGINVSTVSEYLRRLRKDGLIRQRLVHVQPHGQARVVTIVATGKRTATPSPSRRFNAPADPPFTPTAGALTSAGRRLTGKEFERRKRELEAREAADAERRRMEARP